MVKCAMSRYQAAIYNWVKATGTLRLDPNNALAGKTRHPFVPLNNKVMELRKVRQSEWDPQEAMQYCKSCRSALRVSCELGNVARTHLHSCRG